MTNDATLLAGRRGVTTIELFPNDPRPCSIDLTDNTNLWGAPPTAERIVRQDAGRSLARYPEPYSESLKAALAQYVGVDPSHIVIGCGSDDVLDSSIRGFAEPGDRIVLPNPTFSMLPFFASANALETIHVTLTADYDVDVEQTLAANAKITYLCSPNNPTANSLPRATLETIVDRARGLVIIDEAYAEFAGRTAVDLTERSDRVIVVRTLSKAFGLAGLRIGYGIASPAVITQVEKSRGPFKVSSTAERAAVAAVTNDLAWVKANAAEAVANRQRFVTELAQLGLTAILSDTNFVLVPLRDAARVATAVRDHDVALKPFSKLAHAPGSTLAATGGDALRITIAPWPMMEQALAALRAVLD
jgi:histidinol-phosphate aminotransferase